MVAWLEHLLMTPVLRYSEEPDSSTRDPALNPRLMAGFLRDEKMTPIQWVDVLTMTRLGRCNNLKTCTNVVSS